MHTHRNLLPMFILLVFALACSKTTPAPGTQSLQTPSPLATSEQSSSLETPQVSNATSTLASDASTATGNQPTIDSLVEGTLAFRNVKISLSTTQPDGSSTSLAAEIDANGDQHLLNTYPENPGLVFSEGMQSPPFNLELYVVGGVAYKPDEDGIFQVAETQEMSFTLKNAILSPDGPAFWLKVFPAGSLTSQGSELFGGFQAQKYAIQGTLYGQSVCGEIWVESSQQSLLGAEIDLPASLYGPQPEGSVHIHLQVEHSDISPIHPKLEA
ncbi:MAG: hypothetical protein FIA98_07600, partial [Anaerolineae bacterium]|nr:hypothetical protein [Anaerolineae bacterium]